MPVEVKIFKAWSSAFESRAVWALQLKGIRYESVLEDISNKRDLLLLYNPVYKKVQVLLHNGRPISESPDNSRVPQRQVEASPASPAGSLCEGHGAILGQIWRQEGY
ncbi:uncharacterized protein J3R85_012880 [Psidium guajava]|nr:uncharacterized protein J3R85_012880 [Psidium guajava]